MCSNIPSLSYFLNSKTNSAELNILFPLNCFTIDISLCFVCKLLLLRCDAKMYYATQFQYVLMIIFQLPRPQITHAHFIISVFHMEYK